MRRVHPQRAGGGGRQRHRKSSGALHLVHLQAKFGLAPCCNRAQLFQHILVDLEQHLHGPKEPLHLRGRNRARLFRASVLGVVLLGPGAQRHQKDLHYGLQCLDVLALAFDELVARLYQLAQRLGHQPALGFRHDRKVGPSILYPAGSMSPLCKSAEVLVRGGETSQAAPCWGRKKEVSVRLSIDNPPAAQVRKGSTRKREKTFCRKRWPS